MATILYAEDDRDCRELFAITLRQKDYIVYEANNGAQAVQIVRDEPVDLVILDVRMPLMTGYDTAKILAKEAPHIPVIFLSAKGLANEVGRGFQCGDMVVDYLVKPISTKQLVKRVNEILHNCQERGLESVRQENMTQLVAIRQFS